MGSRHGGRGNLTGVVAALALATAIVGACGPVVPAQSPGFSGAATIPNIDASLLRYTCGRFPFGAEGLDITSSDELANTPEAAALRAHLAGPGPDIDFLPDQGWKLVGTDATGAEFVTVTDGDPGMVNVLLERGEAGWKVSGWGQCRLTGASSGRRSWA